MRGPSFAVVDDDVEFCNVAGELARDYGFQTCGLHSVEQARRWLQGHMPDLMLVDVRLPDGSGYDVLSGLRTRHQGQVVLVSGLANLEEAAKAVRSSADDFWIKPLHVAKLEELLRNVADEQRAREAARPDAFGLVGSSQSMARLRREISQIGAGKGNVMIFGEPGTGKSLVAKALHDTSRTQAPFLVMDCALHLGQGSAAAVIRATFEAHTSGTLHLRNIDLLGSDEQRMLASLLDQQRAERSKAHDVLRIIASSSEDVQQVTARLHSGLLYRLYEYGIQLPPLRERKGDALDLAEFFLSQNNLSSGQHKRLARQAELLSSYNWSGNVRELEQVVSYAYAETEGDELVLRSSSVLAGRLAAGCGPQRQRAAASSAGNSAGDLTVQIQIGTTMRKVEAVMLQATLKACDGDKAAAARALGVSLRTVHYWLARAGVDDGVV